MAAAGAAWALGFCPFTPYPPGSCHGSGRLGASTLQLQPGLGAARARGFLCCSSQGSAGSGFHHHQPLQPGQPGHLTRWPLPWLQVPSSGFPPPAAPPGAEGLCSCQLQPGQPGLRASAALPLQLGLRAVQTWGCPGSRLQPRSCSRGSGHAGSGLLPPRILPGLRVTC